MNSTCYIIDDEPLAIEVIEAHAEAYAGLTVVDTFGNAVEAFQALRERNVDVIFLDIEMPRLTGLDLLRSLPDPPLVVLTTAHREYAVEGFDLDVVDYLVKPVRFDRFIRAVGKVERRLAGENETRDDVGDEPDAVLTIVVDRRRRRVPVSRILYIESRGDRVEIHTDGRVFSTYRNLSELADELKSHGMIRIHRSFIVARDRVDSWSASEVVVGGKHLPIGRTYRAAIRRELGL